jgi:hypothetical protein
VVRIYSAGGGGKKKMGIAHILRAPVLGALLSIAATVIAVELQLATAAMREAPQLATYAATSAAK